ncbi:hypothetical protein EMIT0P171_40244 [Pseudomonas sp. IT-P171]
MKFFERSLNSRGACHHSLNRFEDLVLRALNWRNAACCQNAHQFFLHIIQPVISNDRCLNAANRVALGELVINRGSSPVNSVHASISVGEERYRVRWLQLIYFAFERVVTPRA